VRISYKTDANAEAWRSDWPAASLADRLSAMNMTLSSSAELLLRLHWVAVLRSRVRALSGGVQTVADGIKSILVGADIVQLVSTILRHGPQYFRVMQDGLSRWAEKRGLPRSLICAVA